MPDLGEQLSAILQNPEAQQNIMAMLNSLGAQNNISTPTPNPSPQNSGGFDLSSIFQGNSPDKKEDNPLSGIDINMLMKVQQIFARMNCDDSNVGLLRALKPHLRQPGKIDSAIQFLQLMSVLPALGESGIFGGGSR